MAELTAPATPVILTGMHRSGTSLVAQLLRRCGLFIGAERDHNEEARFFLRQNERVLQLAHAAWDAPENLDYLWPQEDLWQPLATAIGRTVASEAAQKFGGARRPWRSGQWNPDAPWGWKDPRSGLLLPLWHRLYPGARVVHVVRHGVDVALSLQRREQAKQTAANPYFSPRCRLLTGSFSLWVHYVSTTRRHLETWPHDQQLTVHYESLLTRPVAELERLARFCGLAPAPQTVAAAVADVEAGRAFAFQHSEKGRAALLRLGTHPLLAALNYPATDWEAIHES